MGRVCNILSPLQICYVCSVKEKIISRRHVYKLKIYKNVSSVEKETKSGLASFLHGRLEVKESN